MDDGGRCLLDVIGMDIEGSFPDFVNVKGDPSALQSFLEGGDELKLSSPHLANSLEGSPLEVDYSLRTNGSHLHDILVRPVLQPSSSPQVGHSPFNQHAAGQPPPSPAPSPFSVPSRSPIQLSPSQPQQNNTLPLRSPRPCASPSTHAYPPTPSPGTPLYQTKSPAPTASPLSYPLSQSRSPAGSTPALSPAPPGAPVATTLNLATTAVGSPMVQFLPAPVPQSAVATASRPHMSSVKPIQPKQPQILPKPAAGSPQFGAKPVTVNHRNATVAVGPAQANQIVIGAPQNQAATAAVLPNAVGGQGTLLLNHISLGLAPNPQLVFQGGAGGLQNLQLVVRPQQAGLTTANPSSQPPTHTNPGALNQAAFLQALQVQNHAAQQALINQAKNQQAVMIPGGANLLTSAQALSGRQNVLLSTRLVNTNQGPLQLQTFQTPQGPVTVAIAPQQNLRNIQNLGMPMGQMGQMLQGMAVTQAPQTQFTGHNLTAGVMLNNQPVTSMSVSPDLMPTLTPEQPPPPPPPPKVPSVNLEELLKQTGIVPSDPPPPLPPPSLSTTHTTCPSSSVVVSLPSGHLVTTQAPSISQGTQQVMLNTMQNLTTSRAPSQLMAQLQQSIALTQPQVKLSIAQDGSVYLQRPIVQTVQALPQGVQPSTIPVSIASDTATTTNVPSVLLQRLNATPQNATVAVAAAADGSASLIPLTVQNLNLTGQGQTLLSAAPGSAVSAPATLVTTSVVTTSTSSGLMQMHPTLVQSLTKASPSLPPVIPKTTPIAPQPAPPQPPPPPPPQPAAPAVVATSLANQNALGQQLTSGTTVTISQTVPVITTAASTIAKTEPTNVLMSSPSLGSLPIGSKLQTIQLSPQNQELLQKVQCQLRPLINLKSPSAQQRQLIQQLQLTQNKILAQGKVIACHPAQPTHSFQLQMHPQIQPQPQPQHQPVSVAVTSTSATTTSTTVSIPSTVAGMNVQCSATKPVNLTNILKQNSAPVAPPPRPAPPPIQAPAATTITVPAQIKVNNQVVNLTPQQRQTIQQQLKTLTPDSKPNLLLAPSKQAVILKLQQPAPILPATTAATVTSVPICTSSSPPKSSAPTTITVATSTGLTGGILVLQPNRGIKRPAPTPISQAVLLQQQLASDQASAINPDCKTPFRSGKDACRRLLKYHVFNSKTPTQQDLQKADDLFETVSEQLVEKAHQILSKYRCMLLKQSMREFNTSELVMLNKLLIEDERRELEQDRQAVKEGKDLNLPPPPDHWLPKLNAVADLCTTSTTATVHLASTLTSTPGAITTTSVHLAPLSSVDIKPFRGSGPPALKIAATTPVVKQEEMSLGDDARTKGGSEVGKGGCVLRIKQEKTEDEEAAREEEPPDKNYDEWAAIQKELEMYPLGNGETASDPMSLACSHVDFGDGDVTPEDSCTGLADFEPPVAKAVAPTETMDTSSDWEVFASSSERRPSLSGESEPIIVPENLLGCGSANGGRSRTKNEPGPSLMDATDPKSPEDDLNAQVQCAINSILNLQRGEDVLPFLTAAPVSNNIGVPEEEEEEEEDEDDDEDFALEAMDTSKDEQMTLDYEASAVEVERCEVDDALEEAVKSILM